MSRKKAERLKCSLEEVYDKEKQEKINSLIEHVVIIRFSVDLERTEFSKNIHKLLNKDRLEYRFKLFENFCFPSLSKQSVVDFKVVLVVDRDMPIEFSNRLNKHVINEHNFFVHYWNKKDCFENNGWLAPYIDKKKKFLCTTRMDDDDIIHIKANELFKCCLYKELENLKDKNIYHLSTGIYVHIEKDETLFPIECNNKSLAIFMSLVTPMETENNIYFYSHDIIEKYPELKQYHIISENCKLFGVTNHIWENDTRYMRFAKHKKEKCMLGDIYEMFQINK